MRSNLFFSFFVAILSVCAVYVSWNNAILSKHLVILLTLGQVPGLKTAGPDCDSVVVPESRKSTRFGKHAHCFNSTGGFYWYNAHHNEDITKMILLKALNDRCPVLVHQPFKDDQCKTRLAQFANANPDYEVRVKENVDSVMDEGLLFPG